MPQDLRVHLVLLAQQVPLDLLALPVHKESKVLQEILARLGLPARKAMPEQQDPLVLQAQRAQREKLALQEQQVLQEIRERLDQLVR